MSMETASACARTNHSDPERLYSITNRSEIGCILVKRGSVTATRSRQSQIRSNGDVGLQ